MNNNAQGLRRDSNVCWIVVEIMVVATKDDVGDIEHNLKDMGEANHRVLEQIGYK